jgi:hypothetical protein
MLWEALGRAGWVGEIVSRWTSVALRLGVPMAPAGQPVPQSQIKLLPGGVHRLGPGGWIDDQGVQWQQYAGDLDGRAAGPGYRLLESERDPAKLEFYEDMLYTAAVHAGWLSGDPEQVVDVPEVRVAVGVARRNPIWEAYDADPDSFPFSPMDPGELVGAIDESELLAHARAIAPRNGDPEPALIQHAYGSRFDVTRTTGSIVFSDAPSLIVVMEGNFRARRAPRPPLRRRDVPAGEEFVSYPVQVLVFDVLTGQITDSGSSIQQPDLTPLGDVVTDQDTRG